MENKCDKYGVEREEKDWEKEWLMFTGFCGEHGVPGQDLAAFEKVIRKIVEREYQRGFRKDGKQQSLPPGVSQWKEIGKKYGYWEYFEKEIIERTVRFCREAIDGVYQCCDCNEQGELWDGECKSKLANRKTLSDVAKKLMGK